MPKEQSKNVIVSFEVPRRLMKVYTFVAQITDKPVEYHLIRALRNYTAADEKKRPLSGSYRAEAKTGGNAPPPKK